MPVLLWLAYVLRLELVPFLERPFRVKVRALGE
jgi:hypothetical protein